MVIDSSAMIAIESGEPEREAFLSAILSADTRLISAASYVECVAVMARRRPKSAAAVTVAATFRDLELVIVEVTVEQSRIAAQALEDYGRTRHPAGLNYGDSFVYALAKVTGEPLLFKGDDFALTDVVAAAY
ncbi:type II toxin-antitoxin system VapC family toxin [Caulobacter segnis]|jgi:ribonuclease VapC|uniref:type II toxin-antitoxin system VapC family toxin n=1 Tax=Caulobacter segnis TaxID=88688 RepID=UPI001CBEDB95|nr:type II toxin-antitoxin system VapC family toxin [Caulobacter segnis]UAL11898.1 type II toxin-antitoxin system VapC family toxin [Caulobacter segnis]